MRPIRKDTEQIVDPQGYVKFGQFDRPFANINLLDADAFLPLPSPRIFRRLRLKEWQAFQISHPNYFLNLALFDAKAMGLVQAKIFDKRAGQKYLFERFVPSWQLQPPTTLLDSTYSWQNRDTRLSFRNLLREDRIFIDFELPRTASSPAIEGRLVADTNGRTPMVVSIPFSQNRGMYSHKCLVPLRGLLNVGGEVSHFDGDGCMLIDDHKGYYPRLMRWDWLTSGMFREGSLIGFNLTKNASTDPKLYNENGFWKDGALHQLPPVVFRRERNEGREIWHIEDADGLVDLRFLVEVDGRVDMNLGIVESRYRGPFGSFEGKLESYDGEELICDGMFGMGEDFHLKV